MIHIGVICLLWDLYLPFCYTVYCMQVLYLVNTLILPFKLTNLAFVANTKFAIKHGNTKGLRDSRVEVSPICR